MCCSAVLGTTVLGRDHCASQISEISQEVFRTSLRGGEHLLCRTSTGHVQVMEVYNHTYLRGSAKGATANAANAS